METHTSQQLMLLLLYNCSFLNLLSTPQRQLRVLSKQWGLDPMHLHPWAETVFPWMTLGLFPVSPLK